MPTPDPIPELASLKKRFLKIMRWGALFSLAIAAIAVLLVAKGDRALHIHMLIATALGVGLTVLIGIALMTLLFLSNRSGYDAETARPQEKDNNDP